MPTLSGCTVMVLSGPFRVLQEGRKSCLPNLGVVAPYYLGKPGKGSKGRTLRAHFVGWRAPGKRTLCRSPHSCRLCQQIRWRWHGSSGRSSSGTGRDRLPPTHTHTDQLLLSFDLTWSTDHRRHHRRCRRRRHCQRRRQCLHRRRHCR
jgi:hypothetical protein